YGAASLPQRQQIMQHAPVVPFGVPVFWPYIAGERFYHNATIWPFVTAYWTWAAAEGGNTRAVQHGLDNATRAAALFLTNKENMVASTGHYEGTALNSDRQLWSVAGTLAGTYRLLLGMRLEPDRLVFRPMVPPSYGGERTLRGMRYRGATLDITVRGHGTAVTEARLDGRVIDTAAVPATLTGRHTVELTLNGEWPQASVSMAENRFAPAAPRVRLQQSALAWDSVPGAARYVVYRNGRELRSTTSRQVGVTPGPRLEEYQVLAANAVGDESFLSAPVRVVAPRAVITAEPAGRGVERVHAGYTGAGYVRLERTQPLAVSVPIRVPATGIYALDVRYANGNGPVNTEDKLAMRTVLVDGNEAGVVVMPQRGVNAWSQWGWSNVLPVRLTAGDHRITLVMTVLDENMNRRENTALLDAVRLTRLPDEGAVR
ncbi:MAG TPA: hypothetical protein VFT96_05275, partial [Gemmatimonadaceae bacterium]|nr:hypothetical protein [Gemmatimonadaceae bacterium]